jgi:hypothetical protein
MKNHHAPNLQTLRDNGEHGNERGTCVAALNRAKAVAQWVQRESRIPVTIGFASDLKISEPAPAPTGTGSIESSPEPSSTKGRKHNGKAQ